ncbi:MAG: 1-deoxy-D-xylulose-5-phosphate synthase [Proteobacteria bacterium]|nr:1-deoxy-D-xylulose-5-phosphate synthase [Pseudomonadota bacterium]
MKSPHDIPVSHPRDLKAMGPEALEDLAGRIRQVIIRTARKNGGHLSGSLGAVELTLALHRTFDSPTDRFVWDVGHQAYAHKLVTGRWDRFDGIRQAGGLSGFPRQGESPHDAFSTGHSSTSVSAGLGLAVGHALMNHSARAIAVVGDGALTAGMAWEGLNQAGWVPNNLVVVVNDNGMSISGNVGGLSRILGGPGNGNGAAKKAKNLFESLGFTYLGPVDGHNIPDLLDVMGRARACDGPVVVHVKTVKGRGFAEAEADPEAFHGIAGKNGNSAPKPPSWTEAFGNALVAAAERDPRVVAVTAAMPSGTGLKKFAKRFPDRFFDVGIAEQHAVTFAAGLASAGMRPVVALYSSFLQRAFDQVVHDVCLDNLPVVFAVDRAGLVGEDGPTHHGVLDLSLLRSVPNLAVMAPSDGNELADMLTTALSADGPSAVRWPRGRLPEWPVQREPRVLPRGRLRVTAPGEHALILAVGSMVTVAREAREMLLEKGVEAAVVDARFVKPLDAEALVRLCVRTPRVVTVEENALAGGFGSAVAECLADAGLSQVRLTRLGIEDRFVEHGEAKGLRQGQGLSPEAIAGAVLSLVRIRPGAFARPEPLLAAGIA